MSSNRLKVKGILCSICKRQHGEVGGGANILPLWREFHSLDEDSQVMLTCHTSGEVCTWNKVSWADISIRAVCMQEGTASGNLDLIHLGFKVVPTTRHCRLSQKWTGSQCS